MNTTERFIHQKIDSAVACQITDADIAAPTLFLLFRSEMRLGLLPVYRDVQIAECPSLNKCFEKPDVEGKHLLWIRSRISAFVGDVA